eukprot:206528-Rhodomonas_salina.1
MSVNAFYNIHSNALFIPAAMLQRPLLCPLFFFSGLFPDLFGACSEVHERQRLLQHPLQRPLYPGRRAPAPVPVHLYSCVGLDGVCFFPDFIEIRHAMIPPRRVEFYFTKRSPRSCTSQ